jgi:NADPH:quinone reductase-like Zn-dependent oxidoreductase
MSRIVEFAEAGGPQVLKFKNVEVPEAGPGQVRIRVKALGLNRAESMWREDKYIERPVKFPARLGYEAVGTVDSVGKDVTTIAVGDEVNTIPSFSLNQYGMYGEVVLAPRVTTEGATRSFDDAQQRRHPAGHRRVGRNRKRRIRYGPHVDAPENQERSTRLEGRSVDARR